MRKDKKAENGRVKMGVIRVNKTRDFTVMSNYHFKDKDLSLKAKGLLSQMLSLPDDWDYSIEGLASINKEGVKAIRTILQELENAGYLMRTRVQGENGQFAYIYDIFEIPQKDSPYTQKGHAVEGHAVEGHAVKGTQLNTKELNTKESNTKDIKKERKAKKTTSYDAIIDTQVIDPKLRLAIIEFIKMRKLIKSPLSDYALELLIKKLEKMSPDVNMQVAILEQSIQNSWKGVFPLHQESTKGNSGNKVANQLEDSYEMIKDWVKEKT